MAELAKALQGDILRLEGKVEAEAARVNGRIDKLAMQVKLLIVLALVAIAMFSPNLAALLKLAK